VHLPLIAALLDEALLPELSAALAIARREE
jgi:hypothetical protein